MKNKKDLVFLAGAFAFLLILFVWLRPGERAAQRSFQGVTLSNVASTSTQSLDQCPTTKCLTVYVAPWCGICRRSTALIAALGGYLEEHGVHTRVVVGDGPLSEVQEYARELGPDTLVDPDNQVPVSGGVPNFIVSDAAGGILHASAGVPGFYRPPFSEEVLAEFAAYLNLP